MSVVLSVGSTPTISIAAESQVVTTVFVFNTMPTQPTFRECLYQKLSQSIMQALDRCPGQDCFEI